MFDIYGRLHCLSATSTCFPNTRSAAILKLKACQTPVPQRCGCYMFPRHLQNILEPAGATVIYYAVNVLKGSPAKDGRTFITPRVGDKYSASARERVREKEREKEKRNHAVTTTQNYVLF